MSEDARPVTTLWSDLPKPVWMLVVVVPGEPDGSLPPAPTGAVVSTQTVLSLPIEADDLPQAAVLALTAAKGWTRLPGARADLRPAHPANIAIR